MSDFKIKSRNPIPDFGHTRIDIESPTPCKRQKLDIKPKVIAVRFTPLSLFLLIQKNENLLSNDGLWKRITHIFFDALMYSGNDKIVFGCSQFQQREKFTLSPETYFAVLDQLKVKYNHLNIIYQISSCTFDNTNLITQPEKILDSLKTLLWKRVYDGLEFNFVTCHSSKRVVRLIKQIFPNVILCAVISNELHYLRDAYTTTELRQLYQVFDIVTVNSFGYSCTESISTTPNKLRLIARSESSMQDFIGTVEYLRKKLPNMDKILMGIDTIALKIKVQDWEQMDMKEFSVIALNEIPQYLRNDDYVREYWPAVGGSVIYSIKNNTYISYDTYEVQVTKLNWVLSESALGVMIGDIDMDLEFTSPSSLVQLAYNRFKPVGLYGDGINTFSVPVEPVSKELLLRHVSNGERSTPC